MNEISEILLATDLSEASTNSYPWAAGIARAYGASITLLHVDEVSDELDTSDEVVAYLEELAAHNDRLLKAAQQQIEAWGIQTRVETCRGVPSQQILAVAEQRKVGLVVMAKSGGRVVERLLFGSTTKRVLRSAQLPVLVVHLPGLDDSPRDEPVSFHRLMTTTDFGAASEWGLTAALSLSRRLNSSELLLAHVMRVPLPLAAGALPKAGMEPVRRDATLALDMIIKRFGSSRIQPKLLVGGAVAQTLAETANVEDIDLVIVPSHSSALGTFVGNTAEALLRRATRSVLVFPWRYLQEHCSN